MPQVFCARCHGNAVEGKGDLCRECVIDDLKQKSEVKQKSELAPQADAVTQREAVDIELGRHTRILFDDGDWRDERVLMDWDGAPSGPEYLSLQRGELLRVRVDIQEDGWSWGRSIRHQKTGWFPPAFARPDS